MTLRYFDPVSPSSRLREIAQTAGKAETATTTLSTTVVEERVTVTPVASVTRSWLLKEPAEWGWRELRDYVVHEIESRFGPFPRDAVREASIFKSFVSRYGTASAFIAQAAFEIYQGWWANAPISTNRFCKASDKFFGDVILGRLRD